MNGLVKICGITDVNGMKAALDCGAGLTGLVCRIGSSRLIDFDSAAKLAQMARGRARIVVVVDDADDDFLDALVTKIKPDILQLHGAETPQRVAAIKARFKTATVKTLGIAASSDFAALKPYEPLCERILLEAKMPDGRPFGGSGRAFDWTLLQHLARRDHIMLAGGLNPENVGEAITITGVRAVDVSSGVEAGTPGIKDEGKVRRFIENAHAAFATTSVFA